MLHELYLNQVAAKEKKIKIRQKEREREKQKRSNLQVHRLSFKASTIYQMALHQ
jgi:hypothetical protein